MTDVRTFTVHGCGFHTYSEVGCLWNDRWQSVKSWIADDNTVICEIPEISGIETLPIWVDVKIIFDGDLGQYSADIADFRFGPTCEALGSNQGPVGGSSLSIAGQGFTEFSSIIVYFDEANATGSGATAGTSGSETFTVTAPAGEFNQMAMVNVMFDNNPQYTVHCPDTYHYGPILEDVSPNCGLEGGETLTISGVDMSGAGTQVEVLFTYDDVDIGQRTVLGTVTGNSISVVAPDVISTQADTTTASLSVWFDVNHAQQPLDDKSTQRRAVIVGQSVSYGPSLFSSSGTGYVNNDNQNDLLTITGCGFEKFQGRDENFVTVSGNDCTELSINGDDTLTCIYQTRNNCARNLAIDVGFSNVLSGYTGTGTSSPLNNNLVFQQGPNVEVLTEGGFTRTGPVLASGNPSTFQISGDHLCRDSNCNVDWTGDHGCVFTNGGSTDTTTSNQRNIQTTSMSCDILDSPSSDPGTGSWTVDFGSQCSFTFEDVCYNWGPVITGIDKTRANIAGADSIQLSGESLDSSNDDYYTSTDPDVYWCNTASGSGNGIAQCFNTGGSASANSISTTRSADDDASTRQGAVINNVASLNHILGDQVRFIAEYQIAGGGGVSTENVFAFTSHPCDGAQVRAEYRWGPIAEAVSPEKARMGPAAGFQSLDITVSGLGFDDGHFPTGQGFVTIGDQIMDATISGGRASMATVWGAQSTSQHEVQVIFDNCNVTSTTSTITWGPEVTGASYYMETAACDCLVDTTCCFTQTLNINDINDPDLDPPANDQFWGLKPWGGETLTLTGRFFNDYDDVACVIDGVETPATVDVAGTSLTCTTPSNAYGAQGTVLVIFGTLEKRNVLNWNNEIRVPIFLNWAPTIGDITSGLRGDTSEAVSVTVECTGCLAWDEPPATRAWFGNDVAGPLADVAANADYQCFISQQSGVVSGVTNAAMTCALNTASVEQDTPVRNLFNSDVSVYFAFYNLRWEQDTDPDSVDFGVVTYPRVTDGDWRGWTSNTFHFGPVCNSVSSSDFTFANNADTLFDLTLNGAGFKDTVVIEYYLVNLGGALVANLSSGNNGAIGSVTDGAITATDVLAQPSSCGGSIGATVDVYWSHRHTLNSVNNNFREDTTPITLDCGSYSYGPFYSGHSVQQGTLNTANSIDERIYGWDSSRVTVTGFGFDQAGLGDMSFTIDGTNMDNLQQNSNSILGTVPDRSNTDFGESSLLISFDGSTGAGCEVEAGLFYYGAFVCSMDRHRERVVPQNSVISVLGIGLDSDSAPWRTNGVECTFSNGANDRNSQNGNTVTCDVPDENQYPAEADIRLEVDLGNGNTRVLQQSTDEACAADDLVFHYGPLVVSQLDFYSLVAGATGIRIAGEFLDDPFLSFQDCGNADVIDGDEVSNSATVTCYTRAWDGRLCGETATLQPRWVRSSDDASVTVEGNQAFEVTYGMGPASLAEGSFRLSINGGGTVTVNSADYLCGSSVCNFNNGINNGNCECVTGGSAGGFGNNGFQEANRLPVRSAVCRFGQLYTEATAMDDGSVTCDVPAGYFQYSAEVSVIINPQRDGLTQVPEDELASGSPGTFRWLPYTTGFSSSFQEEETERSFTIQGGGFMGYEQSPRTSETGTVVCYFGADIGTQGDLTDDYHVTCRSPALSAGEVAVRLEFCDHSENTSGTNDGDADSGPCDCDYLGSVDSCDVGTYTYAGITSINTGSTAPSAGNIGPALGPVAGGTTLTINGFGFDRYQNIIVTIDGTVAGSGDGSVNATGGDVSPTQIIVVTPAKSEPLMARVVVTGTYPAYGSVEFVSPDHFDYGWPNIVDVSITGAIPVNGTNSTADSCDIDLGCVVTVTGNVENYWESDTATVECRMVNPDTGVFTTLGDGVWADSYTVECTVPARAVEFIGLYYIEVNMDGLRWTEDFHTIEITQTPEFNTISNDQGSELGGLAVEIGGNSMNGGVGYYCRFGDLVVGGEFTEGDAPTDSPVANGTNATRRESQLRRGTGDSLICQTPRADIGVVSISVSLTGEESSFIDTGFDFEFVERGETYDGSTPAPTLASPTFDSGAADLLPSMVVAAFAALALLN